MRRALAAHSLLAAAPGPRGRAARRAPSRSLDCAPGAGPAGPQRDVRGAHARRARQRPHAGPLHAAGARGRATARWRRVAAPGFDTWLTSDAGVRRYTYAKTVENLAAPAAYRTRRALPLARRRRATWSSARAARPPPCRQPDLRPNLVPRRSTSRRRPTTGDGAATSSRVRNPGRDATRGAVRASACASATAARRAASCSAWRRGLEHAVVTFAGAALHGRPAAHRRPPTPPTPSTSASRTTTSLVGALPVRSRRRTVTA